MKIIGSVLVRNEDLYVEQAIRNVVDFCDRIHVVDHVSDDGTSEIVRALAGVRARRRAACAQRSSWRIGCSSRTPGRRHGSSASTATSSTIPTGWRGFAPTCLTAHTPTSSV
jgi:hypothetical protein